MNIRVQLQLMIGIATTMLASCGGSSEPAKVTYSDHVAAGTIANYTDANWLFQNYLGDYGIPAQSKDQFMPALMMLANGFDLQLKNGQDVRKNIEQVHSMFVDYLYKEAGQSFLLKAQTMDRSNSITLYTSENQISSTFVEPITLPHDAEEISKAKQRDEDERRKIEEIATHYRLPYTIENIPEQWFIYSPTMKSHGKTVPPRNNGTAPPKTHGDVRKWGWKIGDIVWVSGTGSIPGVPGHNAIVFADVSNIYLIDSNTDVGVSMTRDLQGWFERYNEVRALTPRLSWSQSDYDCYWYYGEGSACVKDSWIRAQAWSYAENAQGSPYYWNFTNPRNETAFYCSSLVWNAYNHAGYNILAPYNLGAFGIITPNQIRDSKALVTFKVSTK